LEIKNYFCTFDFGILVLSFPVQEKASNPVFFGLLPSDIPMTALEC
jgi:hypothetical protein